MKRYGSIGAWGFGALAAAQNALNQIRVITSKSEAEMAAFRSKIYEISAKTGQNAADLLQAAIGKARGGMAVDGAETQAPSDGSLFKTLETEGKYAKASFSKNVGAVTAGADAIRQQMNLTFAESKEAMAGTYSM